MPITFEQGQPFNVELPGGKYKGHIVERNGDNVTQWIIEVEGKVDDPVNPVSLEEPTDDNGISVELNAETKAEIDGEKI